MFIQLKDKKPFGHPVIYDNFRYEYPEKLYPVLSVEVLRELGYGIFVPTRIPSEIPRYHKAIEDTPIENEHGEWLQQWKIIEMNPEEKEKTNEIQKLSITGQRDFKLRVSDWTVLPDSPIDDKNAWIEYRQKLRDITKQDGFPWEINWPNEPTK